MIRYPVVSLVLVAGLASSPLAAQEVPVVSLDEALNSFVANNLELRGARSRAAEAAGLARQAGAYPNPLLSASHEPLSGGGVTYSESYLTLSQRLEPPGQRGARTEAGDWRWRAARSRLLADSVRLAFELKRTFVETSLSQQKLDITGRVVQAFRDAARSAKDRFDAGDISLYELRRIRVERARFETLMVDADVGLGVAQRSLALMVAPAEPAQRLAAGPLPADSPPPIPADVLEISTVERRAELAAAQADVEALEAGARLARAERVPDVTASGGFKRQSDGLRGAFLGLSVPLPFFDRRSGAVEAAEAGASGGGDRLALTRRELENDVMRAAEAYGTLRRRSELVTEDEDDTAAGAGDLLDIARVAYEAGEMELVELLDAAEALYQAGTAEARLKADLWIAYFDVERALGGFGPLTEIPTTEDQP